MVVEAWHREWSGESFNPMAQIRDASHSLWVLNKEVFEFLELSWRGNHKTMQHEPCHFKQTFIYVCFWYFISVYRSSS